MKKILRNIFLFAVVLYVSLLCYWFFTSVETIKNLCSDAKNMNAENFGELVRAKDLNWPNTGAPEGVIHVLIHSSKNLGTATCLLKIKNGKVEDAVFSFDG